MSERGRNLFNQYVISLLADCEVQEARLDANLEALKFAADASGLHMAEIEEEVGAVKVALAKVLALGAGSIPDETHLEQRVADLENGSEASGKRISKTELDVDSLKLSNKKL
jgi:hypothetical protein